MALTKDRNTPSRDGAMIRHPIKAGAMIYAGALVVLDAGFAEPGNAAAGLVAVGRAEHQADNSAGGDGDAFIKVTRGVFSFENSVGDPVGRTHIGSACYVVDDATVAATHAGNTRSVAGLVVDVDDAGVWVKI